MFGKGDICGVLRDKFVVPRKAVLNPDWFFFFFYAKIIAIGLEPRVTKKQIKVAVISYTF